MQTIRTQTIVKSNHYYGFLDGHAGAFRRFIKLHTRRQQRRAEDRWLASVDAAAECAEDREMVATSLPRVRASRRGLVHAANSFDKRSTAASFEQLMDAANDGRITCKIVQLAMRSNAGFDAQAICIAACC